MLNIAVYNGLKTYAIKTVVDCHTIRYECSLLYFTFLNNFSDAKQFDLDLV